MYELEVGKELTLIASKPSVFPSSLMQESKSRQSSMSVDDVVGTKRK